MSKSNEAAIICQGCGEVASTVDYSPGRAAPPCSNPDSPAFSDPGEGLAIGEHPDICGNCGAPVTDSYVENEILGYIETDEEESYADAHEYSPEDELDDNLANWDDEDRNKDFDDDE